MSYEAELSFAKATAREAGKIMQRYFNAADIGTTWKSDNTPLTVADTTINKLVIDRCMQAFPNSGVLGEEGSYEPSRKTVWVADPIDGTMMFANGMPISTFMLAMVVDGESVVGVIYDSFLDQLYWASKGGGAFMNGQKINVSQRAKLENSIIDIVYRPGQNAVQGLTGLWDRAISERVKTLCLRSIGYSGALIAAGKLDGVIFGLDKPWDGAAVQIIVEEAGGRMTDMDGKPRKWSVPGKGYVASNGKVHQQLLNLVNG